MPLYDRSQAKESGFAQVRESMVAFEGDVVAVEEGEYPAKPDGQGGVMKKGEYIDIKNINVKVLEVTEELTMIPTEWDFRVNTSMSKGSFWIEEFLKSADDNNIQMPNGLVGKRILWRKKSMPFKIKGEDKVATNFVIDKIVGSSPAVAPKITPVSTPAVTSPAPAVDLMEVALELAVGKTEALFREAVSSHPQFVSSPLLPLAKAGGVTQALLSTNKLKLVGDVYQKA